MFPATGSTITAAISPACSANSRSTAAEVVVRGGQRVRNRARCHSGGVRKAERGHARARLDEQKIRVTVVAAGELDDLRALGERTREPERAHRRLGAGVDEAHELEARHRFANQARELELERARRAVARAAANRLLERGDDAGMRVTEDERPPGEDVVDVAVPVDVDEVRALSALDEHRAAADCPERPHGRGDASGHELDRLGEEPLGGLPRHPRTPASDSASERAASSPEWMQSGMPTPRYAAPASARPG